jgi:hypothetical protein
VAVIDLADIPAKSTVLIDANIFVYDSTVGLNNADDF